MLVRTWNRYAWARLAGVARVCLTGEMGGCFLGVLGARAEADLGVAHRCANTGDSGLLQVGQ